MASVGRLKILSSQLKFSLPVRKYILSLLPGSRRHQLFNSSTWTQFMIQGKHVFRRASWMVELTRNFKLWMVFFFFSAGSKLPYFYISVVTEVIAAENVRLQSHGNSFSCLGTSDVCLTTDWSYVCLRLCQPGVCIKGDRPEFPTTLTWE